MRPIMLLIGVVCLVVTCAGGAVLASRPPLAPLLPGGATDIDVAATGWWEWSLTYRTPGPAYAWYFAVVHQLEAGGWRSEERQTGGPRRDSSAYVQRTEFGLASLVQRVEIDGDLYAARIRLRRRIVVAW